jgi:Flp pilus assembly protein TadD
MRRSSSQSNQFYTAAAEEAADVPLPAAPQALLVQRARRLRRRGETRRAMLILREACHTFENCARLWTLYAVECTRLGRRDDAVEALERAIWLRDRNRDAARARVTRQLLERLTQGNFPRAA